MPGSQVPAAMSGEEDEAASQGIHSVIDEILDLYRFNWVPEYRLKFKKELADYTLGFAASKPHEASTRLRLTLKPNDENKGLGKFMQKVLVMPQQSFAAMYSRKLAMGFLRFQFVLGYFWDTRRPSLDYRLTTKWNDGLRFKRKENIQPTKNLLVRTYWSLDMQLPEAEGHLGGGPGSTQVPVEVEYGNLDFSVTQVDFVCDFDGFKNRKKPDTTRNLFTAAQPLESAAGACSCSPCSCSSGGLSSSGTTQSAALGSASQIRISWPWQPNRVIEMLKAGLGGYGTG